MQLWCRRKEEETVKTVWRISPIRHRMFTTDCQSLNSFHPHTVEQKGRQEMEVSSGFGCCLWWLLSFTLMEMEDVTLIKKFPGPVFTKIIKVLSELLAQPKNS